MLTLLIAVSKVSFLLYSIYIIWFYMDSVICVVCSTNDRMSIWQLAWKELLHSASVPFEEAHVNWKKNAKKAAWR